MAEQKNGDDPTKNQAKEETSKDAIGNKDVTTSEFLASLMRQSLGLADSAERPEQILKEVTVDGVVKYLKSGKCKNVITMAGAGISTSAGIPDFRSPGTGLYDNLQKYNLPHPQAIFEIGFFQENPEPFFALAKELYPGTFKPTPCHYFIKQLEQRNLLLRHYTQNIDTLERVAGLSGDKIVEAHGTFHTAHCLSCRQEYSMEFVRDSIFADKIPECTECKGLVKPDIVFFGEALPDQFFKSVKEDLPKCDLLIIMGTSLAVQPFASLVSRVPDTCPRLYINLENSAGGHDPLLAMLGMGSGFKFDDEDNYRDVFLQGTCDDGCLKLADKLGWKNELEKEVTEAHARIDKEKKKPDKKTDESSASSKSPKKSTHL